MFVQAVSTEVEDSEDSAEEESHLKNNPEEISKDAFSNKLRRRSTRRSIKKSEMEEKNLEVQTVQPVSLLGLEICISGTSY